MSKTYCIMYMDDGPQGTVSPKKDLYIFHSREELDEWINRTHAQKGMDNVTLYMIGNVIEGEFSHEASEYFERNFE